MKTIKDYAKEKGVSHQAVYQMLNTHKEELQEHIVTQGRTRYLTPAAEEILENYRNKSPIVLEQIDKNERIEELEQENRNLLIKIATQADRITELAEWKADHAVAIAEADQRQMLLEEKSKEICLLEGFLRDSKNNLEHLQEEKAAAVKSAEDRVHLAEQRIVKLEEQLEAEKNKKWYEKLFRR